ncbi:MAG: hypothetical protein AAFV80_09770 [Bacteroidota bacterium]
MKKNMLLLLFCLGLIPYAFGQNTLKISDGNLKTVGNTFLVLNNTQWVNNGTFDAGTGTVALKGSGTNLQSAISGDSLTTFYNLQLNKSSNGAQLNRSATVNNQLQMTAGNLTLNNNNLTLGTANGTIIGESETSRVTGTTGGVITKTITLNAPSNLNPGNLGCVLTSSANIGSVTVRRGHVPQTVHGSTQSIERYFEFDAANTANYDLSVKFQYFNAELNALTESTLGFWRQDSTLWFNPPVSSFDANTNEAQISNVNVLSKWTLATESTKFSAKVILEGAYSDMTSLMTDVLRTSNLIPTKTPYQSPTFQFGSGEGNESINPAILTTTGNDAIVDWVYVAIRDGSNAVISARSALLQRDGDIVDLDGRSPLSFPEINTTGSNFLSIRHRNHLGIRSLNTLTQSSTATSIDFTTSNTLVLGGANALKLTMDGKYVLFSGDFSGDGQVQIADLNGLIPFLGQSGYLPGDIDLNGQVQNVDAQTFMFPNFGRGAQYTY